MTRVNSNGREKAFQRHFSVMSCASLIAPFTLVVCFLLYPNGCSGQQTSEEPSSKIVILKQRHILEFHQNGKPVRTYRVCLGLNPLGSKRVTGDAKTPEGEYFICYKNAASRFHRFLGISYPSAADAQTAFESGLISLDKRDYIVNTLRTGKAPPWDTTLGGWVGIHGYPSDENERKWVTLLYPKPDDWTDGCIAMWDFEIEELFSKVSLGTPVIISP
ncbi:MAG: L,D-transpeptidase [Desulfomonilaceae bacterium]